MNNQDKPGLTWAHLNKNTLKEATRLLQFLKTRRAQKLIKYLTDSYQSVTDIYINARMEQSEVSQLLRGMRYFDLVHSKRDGKNIFYKLNTSEINRIKSIINKIATLGDQDSDNEDDGYTFYPAVPINPIYPARMQAIGHEI